MNPVAISTREQAERLARENRKIEPLIRRIYWFPADDEVRLVEIVDDAGIPASDTDAVCAFHFPPEPGLPHPSGIALIREAEYQKRLPLPPAWGDWDDAVELT